VQRVLDAGLLFFQLGFGRRADVHWATPPAASRGALGASRGHSRTSSIRSRDGSVRSGPGSLPIPGAFDDRRIVVVNSDELRLPSCAISTLSSSMPRSFMIASPPVRMAMSSSIALRRSP
jgi:hypothetical protein